MHILRTVILALFAAGCAHADGTITMNEKRELVRVSATDKAWGKEPYVVTPDAFDYSLHLEALGRMKPGQTRAIASWDTFNRKLDKLRERKLAAQRKVVDDTSPPDNVGVATMDADGTLRLNLRSVDHGMIAEALKVVPPGDSEYAGMVKHLGGMKPGESKAIPPFPSSGVSR